METLRSVFIYSKRLCPKFLTYVSRFVFCVVFFSVLIQLIDYEILSSV